MRKGLFRMVVGVSLAVVCAAQSPPPASQASPNKVSVSKAIPAKSASAAKTATAKPASAAKTTPAAKPAATTKKAPPKTASSAPKKSPRPAAPVRTAAVRPRQMQPTPERYHEIQDALVAKGYLKPELATGFWDQNSIDALKRFQAEQKLDASGKITSMSLIALGLGPRHDAAPPPIPPANPNDARPEQH